MTHQAMITEAVQPLIEDSKFSEQSLGEIESIDEFEDRNCIGGL